MLALVPIFVSLAMPYTDSYAWASEPWTRNDSDLRQVRTQVEALAPKGTKSSPPSLYDALNRAIKKAKSGSPNYLDSYRVGCLLCLVDSDLKYSGLVDKVITKDYRNYTMPVNLLAEPEIHRSYEYSRIRFMVETRFGHVSLKLKSLAERLLQKDPDDALVVAGTIQILMTDRATLEDNRKAVALVDREIKRTGDNGTKQYFKAFSILAIWQKTKSKSDLKDMKVAAQKCLSDKSISQYQRSYCEIMLKFIDKEMKK